VGFDVTSPRYHILEKPLERFSQIQSQLTVLFLAQEDEMLTPLKAGSNKRLRDLRELQAANEKSWHIWVALVLCEYC